MVSQREGQLPAGTAAPRQDRATPLEKVGWSLLGVAVALWIVACAVLVYGASSHTGWVLLAAFVALITGGLAFIVTGGLIERFLFRGGLFHNEPTLSPAGCSWVEHWEELMRRPVR